MEEAKSAILPTLLLVMRAPLTFPDPALRKPDQVLAAALLGSILDSLDQCGLGTMRFQEGALSTPTLNLKPTCHKFIKEREDELSSFHAPVTVLSVH